MISLISNIFDSKMSTQKLNDWIYYNHIFAYRKEYDDRDTPWVGHTFFAYDLIRNLKPELIVELGTHKGTSFYSMLEAMKDEHLKTNAFAVDSWEGDENAGTAETGYDSEEVYEFVKAMLRKHFGELNVRMVKEYFDNAVSQFEDNSISVLHIDGLHTYEAVKNDYDTWKSKLAENSVLLFHDISVADFGVWKLWEEVKEDYSDGFVFEFRHSYGLGVAVKGDLYVEQMKQAISDEDAFRDHYKRRHEEETNQSQIEKYLEDINAYRIRCSRYEDDIKNLKEENSVLKRQTFEIEHELENHQKELAKTRGTLNSLISRKFIKIYRKLAMLIGKDIPQ